MTGLHDSVAARSIAGFLLAAAVFGGAFHLSVPMNHMSGHDTPCGLMPGGVVCDMDPIAHVSALHEAFTSMPAQYTSLLLLLCAVFVIGFTAVQARLPLPLLAVPLRPQRHRRIDVLTELFSNGVLNSKTY